MIASLDATVPVGRLPRVLSQWILCKERDILTPAYLQTELRTISNLDYQFHPEHRNNEDPELYALSDEEDELKVIKKSSNSHRSAEKAKVSPRSGPALGSNVDFVSFCKLCDRLIVLHESQE